MLHPSRIPSLGWNSWNAFRTGIDEELIIAIADAMVSSGMRDAGYRTLVVDDGWQAYRRCWRGELQAHPHRFPSGMAALGAELAARGLRFGLYLTPGTHTCAELHRRYGVRAGLGSHGHEQRDLDRLAEWGVSHLKLDWCGARRGPGLDQRQTFERWSELVDRLEVPMTLAISEYGFTRPWRWASGQVHSWRTTVDIAPYWASVLPIAWRTERLWHHAGDGGLNDADMLEVGNGLDDEAGWSHLAMWVMLGSPLMAGNDLRTQDEATRRTLTDPDLLAIAQDRRIGSGRIVRRSAGVELWQRPLADGGFAFLAVNVLPIARRLPGVIRERLSRDPVRLRRRTGPGELDQPLPPRGALLALPG